MAARGFHLLFSVTLLHYHISANKLVSKTILQMYAISLYASNNVQYIVAISLDEMGSISHLAALSNWRRL